MTERIGFLSVALERAMAAAGLSGYELAANAKCSYEHIRKMLRSKTLPSRRLAQGLCRVLGMNIVEAQRLITLDICRRKYGASFWNASGRNPELDEFYVLWYFLNDAERDMFATQLRALAQRKNGR